MLCSILKFYVFSCVYERFNIHLFSKMVEFSHTPVYIVPLQKTSLFSTLYFQGSPKKVQKDAENRREWIRMASFISRFIKTLEISQYNRFKKMRTSLSSIPARVLAPKYYIFQHHFHVTLKIKIFQNFQSTKWSPYFEK